MSYIEIIGSVVLNKIIGYWSKYMTNARMRDYKSKAADS